MQQSKLDKVIKTIESLSTLPVVSQRILAATANENTSFKQLVPLIEQDQPLTLKVLKVANSSFFGFLSKVSSLENALVKLGLNEVKSIVLATSVHNFFPDEHANGFDRRLFWKHAILCSQLTKYLSRHYNLPNDDSLFLSGLIHDMGKLVLDQYLHENFMEIIADVSVNRSPFSKSEKKIIGTTHYQIGAKLLKQWKFPSKVIMQVLYHHAPWYAKNYETNSIIVYLSNLLTKMAGFTSLPNEDRPDPHEFIESAEADYIIKSGFELNDDLLSGMINYIHEFVRDESDNVMSLFD